MANRSNKHIIRPLLAIMTAVFIFTSLTAAQQQAKPQVPQKPVPIYGDAIIIGALHEPDILVPILAPEGTSQDIVGLLFNGVTKFDKDLNVIPDLAQKWEISDDGLTITFYLRQNVRWHDGKLFTADDVKFTYEKLIDPDIKTLYSGAFGKIAELKTPDRFTVQVVYKEPFSPGLADWAVKIMPKHILENQDLNAAEFSKNPVGTGPYKFKSWKPGERIDLEFNPDYFEGRPSIDRVVYKIMPDQAAMLTELKSQTIDMMQLTPGQYKQETDDDAFKTSFNKFRYPSLRYTFIAYNLQDPRFKERSIRRAVNSALDQNAIVRDVLMGCGRVCTAPFPPDGWAYNKEIAPMKCDKRWAKMLLEQAGWRDTDKDGLINKNGKPFEFTLLFNEGIEEHKAVADIFQKKLSELGIRVNIKALSASDLQEKVLNKKEFEAAILERSFPKDPEGYADGLGFITYKSEMIKNLLEKARRSFDQESRASFYKEIHRIIDAEQPRLFLYTPDQLRAVHKRFRGPRPGLNGMLYNITDWRAPKAEQKYLKQPAQ
ncbi:MAG: peptide-binding protein [Candidatus Omnitrophica bacterium]|nr:peptide-binding protein [Candidatus Omnitrophota bacterium]